MAVEVVHGLTAVGFTVNDKTGALFAAAQAGGKFLRAEKEPAQKARIGFGSFHYIGDMPFGNDKEVNRRLGVHIVEGQKFIILKNLFRGDFPFNYFTKNTIAHNFSLP
jgi:hypothetical protein